MKIKIDEDLPKAVAESIRSVAPDTLTVMEEGLSGVLDPVLWETAQKEGRFLITGDKAFANIRHGNSRDRSRTVLLEAFFGHHSSSRLIF